jgi:signal peptidase
MLKAFIRDANFGISVLLVALAIGVAAITLPIFGNRALIVKSGSMQPTIKVGDLVAVQSQKGFATPQDVVIPKYKIGDIIAFKNQVDPKIVTTHRIVSRETKDGRVYYQTRGDANNSSDNNVVLEENIIGRADYSVKGIGKLFTFAKSRMGLSLLVIFPALMVIVIEFANLLREFKRNHDFSNQIQFPSSAGIKVLIPVLALALMASFTFAFFSKSATSTGNIFSASQAFPTPTPSPTSSPSAGDIVINELNWAGSTNGSSDEWIELRNTTSHTVDISNWQITKWSTSPSGHEVLMLTIPVGNSILAGGQFLIADKSPGVGTALTATPDVIDSSVVLENTNLQIKLYVSNWNAGGLLIDTAGNTSAPLAGEHSTGSPKKFYSMERNSTPSDGTIAGNWHTAITFVNLNSDSGQNKGTPGATND